MAKVTKKYVTTRNGKKRLSKRKPPSVVYRVKLISGEYFKCSHSSKPYVFRTFKGASTRAVLSNGEVEPLIHHKVT